MPYLRSPSGPNQTKNRFEPQPQWRCHPFNSPLSQNFNFSISKYSFFNKTISLHDAKMILAKSGKYILRDAEDGD